MQQRLRLGHGEQCSMILKMLRLSVVASVYFPNALPMQQLDNLLVTHQAQVMRRGFSYKASFF